MTKRTYTKLSTQHLTEDIRQNDIYIENTEKKKQNIIYYEICKKSKATLPNNFIGRDRKYLQKDILKNWFRSNSINIYF